MGVNGRLWVSLHSAVHLTKAPLCLMVGYSALFGFFVADQAAPFRALLTGIALFFLAAGAATVNSIQEHRTDAYMERTKKRPLPEKTVSLLQAGILAVLLLSAGMIFLDAASQAVFPLGMAVLAVAIYNGLYTPLKQRTVLSIIPGALCGAIPPYIGWLVGGGSKTGFEPFLLIALMVLWQVPHFWLVLLHHGRDYKKGIMPSLFSLFEEEVIRRMFITWVGGLVSVMILFTILPVISSYVSKVLIILNSIILLICFTLNFLIRRKINYKLLFAVLNGTLFLHMTIIIVGSFSTS